MEKKTHVIVASTILSILVWLSVSMNNQYSIVVRVPFRVSDLPEGISLASPLPRFILVRVRGTGWQVASSYFSTTAAVNFDASDVTGRQFILTSRDLAYSLDVGSSAEVLRLEPDTVLINLDSTMTKKVPVIPNIDVVPREGFMIVGPPMADPDSVTITGARRLLKGIGGWDTQQRKFEKIINEVSTTIPLSDTLAGIVTVDAREVNVRVDVEQVAENTYHGVPVNIIDNFDSAEVLLLPPTVDVTVRGGINEMANVTSDSFHVTVNFHSLSRSSSNSFRPTVNAPAQMQVIAVKPDSIEFIIRK